MDTHRRISPLAYHTLKMLCTLGLLTLLTACPQGIDPSEVEERCSDGLDNNGDDLVDCADPTCALFPSCTGNEHCYNGVDDNGDGLIDCEEESCKALFICLEDIEDCANGRDDDGDGQIDCQDSACAETSVCKPGAEACSGGIDEDNDGQIDCDDEDCKAVFFCLATIELPGNQLDDDGDGQVDCEDPDIARTSACLDGGELCDDSLDNDGDGLLDCADPDCSSTSSCLFPAEVCDNGVDDDNDGDVDCDDLNCQGRAICAAELCGNDRDDDGNGLTDCEDPTCRYIGDCLLEAGAKETQCGNMLDDDGDGDIDCADADCANTSACGGEQCDDMFDNDGDGQVDCQDTDCVNDPACILEEVCGNELDDDNDGDTDCDDIDCQADLTCQPEICDDGIDNNGNNQIDCEDAACIDDARCQCEALDKLIDPITQQPIDDCSQTQCLPYFTSCQTDLPQELCQWDGIDNDGDGLIDCEDPDCQDFSDNDAYCTRALCGDPLNNYLVVDFEDTTPEPTSELYITDAQTFQDTISSNQVTLFRGDIYVESFDGAPFALDGGSSLRCVLPHPTIDTIKGQLMLDTSSLTATSALSNLTVLGRLLFRDNASFAPAFGDMSNLTTILGDLAYVVPFYMSTPPTPKTFEGFEALRRIGGHLILDYYTLASNDIQPRPFSLQGLSGLVEVGGDLLKTRNYYDEDDDPSTFGCRIESEAFSVGFKVFRGDYITLDSTQPLSALRRVGGTICFAPSDAMMNFAGLERLEYVGEHFLIMGRSDVNMFPGPPISLTGLERLSRVEGIFSNDTKPVESFMPSRPITSTTPLTSLESVGTLYLLLDETFQNFDGLQNLVEIQEDLLLLASYDTPSPLMLSLQGLNNLTSIGGRLTLNDVDLVDFTGLDSLESVGSIDLYLGGRTLPSFESFAGLGALQTITDKLQISNYFEDLSLDAQPFLALSSLTTLGKLQLYNLNTLTSLAGLDNVTQLSALDLSTLPQLSDISALGTLTAIQNPEEFGQAISLYDTGLTTLDGLAALTSIRGEIYIDGNMSLVEVDQLERLTSLDTSYVSISYNSALSQCLVEQAFDHMVTLDADATYSSEENLTCF